jgi:hypothetical protein
MAVTRAPLLSPLLRIPQAAPLRLPVFSRGLPLKVTEPPQLPLAQKVVSCQSAMAVMVAPVAPAATALVAMVAPVARQRVALAAMSSSRAMEKSRRNWLASM